MVTQLPSSEGAQPPNFRPISVVAKRLDGLRCHLVWRQDSAQATLCLMGIQLTPKKGTPTIPPSFWPMSIVVRRLDGSRCRLIFCVMGSQLPPKQGTAPPNFSVHVYCGQTAGWMKTSLGTEVNLGPGHSVLDGVPAPKERGTGAPPLFGRCLLWPRSSISTTAELL